MVWHGDNPALKDAILDPKGAVSVYGKVQIPTGRKKRVRQGTSGFGDLDPPNSRLALLLLGELEVSALDDEELGYGVPRCDDGKFSIKAAYDASQIPARIQAKIKRELMDRANRKIGANVMSAIERIVEIATSPSSDDKDAMKAADWLATRFLGKNVDVVEHRQERPFEVVIENIERSSRAGSREKRGMVVEGSVVRELGEPQPWTPAVEVRDEAVEISRGRRIPEEKQ
jgi:hypothetical protein